MKIALLLAFAFWLCLAEPPRQALPPEQVKGVLQSIRDSAIVFGNGPRAIHSFIDPKCEMSRRYMGFVMKKKEMLKRYTYYFYLLELKRLDSRGYIGYIFESSDPAKVLTSIMLNDLKPEEAQEYLPDEKTEERMERIIEAAATIGVYKRPYIIYNGKAK
jgi:hypothetical protein